MPNRLPTLLAICAISSIATFGVIGCDKEETKPAPAAIPSPPPADAHPPSPGANTDMKGAMDAAKTDAAAAKDKMGDMASAAADSSQKMIDQAVAYIKDNKLDLADKTLKEIDAMRDKLSPALQENLDKAKKMLADAKAKPAS